MCCARPDIKRATPKIPQERRSKNQLMLPISDAKRLKLGNEATDIEKRLERSYENDRSENEHKVVSAINKNIKYFYSYAKKCSVLSSHVSVNLWIPLKAQLHAQRKWLIY